MPSTLAISTKSALQRIQEVLHTIDALPLPRALRPAVETLLVRQAAKMMDGALPWQRGHGRRTAALARRVGACAKLSRESLHHLTLAALLHDIGLLALPLDLVSHTGCLDAQSYATRQSHPRVGARVLAIADAFDAIQVPEAIDQDSGDGAAYRILTVGAGTQFDPHLVELCRQCLQRPNLIFSFN